MANIKFSQFTVGNTESDIDFVVGYKGANNIQISPANLLSATLAGYLPLTGGTMTAGSSVLFPDNSFLRFGTSADATIYHDGINTYFKNFTGDLILQNNKDDADIIFQSDDGSGGVTPYITLDGSATQTKFSLDTKYVDGVKAKFGDSNDLNIYHNGDSFVVNETGNLKIVNGANDKDIIFESDNGSGGTTEYFKLDGSRADGNYTYTTRPDGGVITFGDSLDLRIWHDPSTNFSYIRGYNNDLYIESDSADKDILFRADNGSGGTATYFVVDGSARQTRFYKDTRHADNIKANFGNGDDLKIWHDGTDSIIQNDTGDLEIQNRQDDGDIVFKSDDGSGGVAEYIRIDGGNTNVKFSKDLYLLDNVKARIGTGSDLQIYHNASNSIVENFVGDLILKNSANDKDIIFQSDNGSGSTATYFLLDGSIAPGTGSVYTRFPDNSRVVFGTGSDLQIYHNATDSLIDNNTGHLYITNYADNKNIYFRTDDGSGGTTEYFRLDGGATKTVFSKNLFLNDSVNLGMGNSGDYAQFHDGTNTYLSNGTGDFYIRNQADDKDIIFQADDGSGGNAEYFRLDGSTTKIQINKEMQFFDNVKATFGFAADLQIYHDGSNSFITESNTGGSLIIRGSNFAVQSSDGTDDFITTVANQGVKLFYNDVEKLETTSTGIKISGVSEYADNTAAIAGGLTTGDVYRTGDLLKIVH